MRKPRVESARDSGPLTLAAFAQSGHYQGTGGTVLGARWDREYAAHYQPCGHRPDLSVSYPFGQWFRRCGGTPTPRLAFLNQNRSITPPSGSRSPQSRPLDLDLLERSLSSGEDAQQLAKLDAELDRFNREHDLRSQEVRAALSAEFDRFLPNRGGGLPYAGQEPKLPPQKTLKEEAASAILKPVKVNARVAEAANLLRLLVTALHDDYVEPVEKTSVDLVRLGSTQVGADSDVPREPIARFELLRRHLKTNNDLFVELQTYVRDLSALSPFSSQTP